MYLGKMTEQLFSESLLKMAGIPLEEEPRKILEPRRVEGREEKQKHADWKRVTELIRQTGGHIDLLDLSDSNLTELPEGIISAHTVVLNSSKIQKLPSSLKKVDILEFESAIVLELPEELKVKRLYLANCEFLEKIPSYKTLVVLSILETEVEEIGEYPRLKQLYCENTPFAEKAEQEAQVQGIDVVEYIKQKHKLPSDCIVEV